MSRKGGYKIIDFKGIELTDATNIDGIRNDIINSKEKVLLISGAYLNGVKQEDEFATFTINKNTIYIKTSYGSIEIGLDDVVDYVEPNKLKLVATGTYDEQKSQSVANNHSVYFKLDNKLEDNKLYIVTYGSLYDNISITLLSKDFAGSVNVTSENEDGVTPLKVYLSIDWENNEDEYIVFNNDGENVTAITDLSTINIYELPFTF